MARGVKRPPFGRLVKRALCEEVTFGPRPRNDDMGPGEELRGAEAKANSKPPG